ncbi:MAG: cytochrome c peroxidase [Bacteroidota bacterium]
MCRRVTPSFLLSLILLNSITSCSNDQQVSPGSPSTPTQDDDEVLDGPKLPQKLLDYSATSTFSNDVVTLGRVLFYDKNLSANGTTSCGSWSKQAASFAENAQYKSRILWKRYVAKLDADP